MKNEHSLKSEKDKSFQLKVWHITVLPGFIVSLLFGKVILALILGGVILWISMCMFAEEMFEKSR